jgi:hypothetical protein
VLSVAEGVSAELRGLTVTRGFVDQEGAGIANLGSLTLVNSTVTGNNAERGGGGIYSWRQLTLTNSTVSGNSTTGSGGGIYVWRQLTLTNSTVSGNSATGPGGGIFSSHTTLTNSTVSGNSGGGIYSLCTTLTNSTVSGNNGLGIHNGGELLTVTNSTVSGNSDGSFDASNLTDDGPEPVTVSLTNSTVSGDITGSLYSSDIFVANTVFVGVCSLSLYAGSRVLSNGYNIESPGNTCGFDQQGDQANVTEAQLNLGELADNGGPTMTHALGDGSVAIDVIPDAACEVAEDQRGEPRDTMCDVGAFEVQP